MYDSFIKYLIQKTRSLAQFFTNHLLAFTVLWFTIITIILLFLNHRLGGIYIGLDNISPFWGIQPVLAQIKHTDNFFAYGPSLFSWWFYLFSLIGFSASFISTVYVWGYFFLAMFGYFFLTKEVRLHIFQQKSSNFDAFIFPFIFIIILVPLWIFTTHELMFMSIFTSIPYLILYGSFKKYRNYALFPLYVLFIIPMFFSSSINLVVFVVGLLSICVFMIVLNNPDKKFRFIPILIIGYLLTTQILIWGTESKRTVFESVSHYVSILSQSTDTQRITNDLQLSEIENGNFSNIIRFATGWMAIYKEDTSYVFPWVKIYRENILLGITQIFVITTIMVVFINTYNSNRKAHVLFITALVSILCMSYIGNQILTKIPVVQIAFRSSSSKLWLFYYIPFLIMATLFFRNIIEKKQYIIPITILLITTVVIFNFPLFTGQGFYQSSLFTVPTEIEEYYQKLEQNDTVVVIPTPQVIYFRQESWGYYGSELASYMSTANVLDGMTLSKHRNFYYEQVKKIKDCGAIDPVITKIVVSDNTKLCPEYTLTSKNRYFYEYARSIK